MINRTLQDIIEESLARGYEGGYWDYKSDYPDSKEDKLHDIICMANNLEDRDAYLIYGAADNGTVLGIEKSVKSRYTSASIEHAEYLWRKHFGYDLRPSKRLELLLGEFNGWSDANWDNCRQQFHIDYPEYRIVAGELKDGYNSISYFYDDERMLYTELKLEYLTTTLYETELWYMDMGRCIIPKLEWKNIIGKGLYCYFLKIA